MSCTEIFAFGKDGTILGGWDVKNSWRGAMAVWTTLEKKYLPSLSKPLWVMPGDEERDYWSRTTMGMFNPEDPNGMKAIWDLYRDGSPLTRDELIVLGSTFDYALVEGSHIEDLCKAFRSFEGETSLSEQADAIEKLCMGEEISAIGWNQTSVSENQWMEYSEEVEEEISYNCLTGDKHWWLFEDLNSERKKV